MGTHPIFESDFDCLTDMSDEENDIAYSVDKGKAKGPQGEYSVDGRNSEDQRDASHGNTDKSTLFGCKKCGYPGHLSYECRNGVKSGAYSMVLDLSSTSSDDEDVRLLKEIKASIKERKRRKKAKKDKKAKMSKRERVSISSDSDDNSKKSKKQKKS